MGEKEGHKWRKETVAIRNEAKLFCDNCFRQQDSDESFSLCRVQASRPTHSPLRKRLSTQGLEVGTQGKPWETTR
ncbi:hypothetical protein FRB93_012988 [Tulasnella sp. JGI-2019a]|nr:hypothetical protein FRB93_012988 [Tulasnella sp. JGI-2019a]